MASVSIKDLEIPSTKTFSSHQVKKLCQLYNDYITELEEEIAVLKSNLPYRPHNERGAGRKHKATTEQRKYILSLYEQGVSQHQIARMMTERTGGKWNKTTIRNIIIAAKK